MAKQGNTIQISTPEQAQAAFRTELVKYAAPTRKLGLGAPEPQPAATLASLLPRAGSTARRLP